MEVVAELKDRLKKALEINEKKPIDLSKDLDIPKSAISQYLSGSSKNMTSKRLYSICRYLHVSEAWMMGYDVPMTKAPEQLEADEWASVVGSIDKQAFELLNGFATLTIEQKDTIIKLVKDYNNFNSVSR